MSTDDWYLGFAKWVTELIPRGDWPPLDGHFWKEIRRAVVTSGATREVAWSAARRLHGDPPAFLQDFPKALQAKIREVHREGQAEAARAVPASVGTEDHSEWNRAAFETWSHLDETERDVWRRLARQRIPMFRGESSELLAIAWAHDPASVVSLPPPRDVPKPTDRRGPRRLFEPIEKV